MKSFSGVIEHIKSALPDTAAPLQIVGAVLSIQATAH